jgi:hypothetical protein
VKAPDKRHTGVGLLLAVGTIVLVCDLVCARATNFRQTTMPPDAVGLIVAHAADAVWHLGYRGTAGGVDAGIYWEEEIADSQLAPRECLWGVALENAQRESP